MNLQKAKSLFLKVLIGCLIAAAVLAVVTILIGQFNDITSKALLTIFLIAVHSLVSFAFIANNEKQDTFDSLEFFTNATFIIIVFSFITAILGTWGILSGDVVARLYGFYFVLLFAILHGEVLAKTTGKQASIDKVVYANYCFMVVVVLMLLPVIFLENSSEVLGSFYYRLLAAFGIIDATLTLIAVILHKLYVQKHPAVTDPVFNLVQPGQQAAAQTPGTNAPATQTKGGMNIFVKILIAYIVLQFLGGIIVAVLGVAVTRH
jgi:hypothetical protein